MFGFYNMFSLALGLAAVVLPIVALFLKRDPRLSYFSMTAGLLSLTGQIAAYNILVRKNDWSALLDTSGFTLSAAVILAALVAVLNLVLIIKQK